MKKETSFLISVVWVIYAGDKDIPDVSVVKIIEPAAEGTSEAIIQSAIDEVSKKPFNKDGFRGTILLKKGTYKIPKDQD
jgi:hypothetical protein